MRSMNIWFHHCLTMSPQAAPTFCWLHISILVKWGQELYDLLCYLYHYISEPSPTCKNFTFAPITFGTFISMSLAQDSWLLTSVWLMVPQLKVLAPRHCNISMVVGEPFSKDLSEYSWPTPFLTMMLISLDTSPQYSLCSQYPAVYYLTVYIPTF